MPSLKVVKPFISQNKIVISRREPLASVSSGRSISPATIRGSTYLPNVSRICALIRSSPTMLLKDCVSRPISSREVSMGRAPEALETAEQYLLATSLAPDQRADKPERVARALG